MRLPRLQLVAAGLCVAAVLRAASLDERVETLFRPPVAGMITLSPDGQRVAYTSLAGGRLAIVVLNIEPPEGKRFFRLEPERDAGSKDETPPLQLRFLRWATNTRLVYAPTERVVPLPPLVDKQGRVVPNPDGPTILAPVFAMDADGKQRGVVVEPRQFQETPAEARRTLADFLRTTKELQATRNEPVRWRMPHLDILGFLPRDREQLIIATHGAYSMPMQHLIDLRTGNIRDFGHEWPAPPGEPQVFDGFRLKVVGEHKEAERPTTVWRDEELARVQRELAGKFPRRTVEIIDWSDTRSRVLCRVTGGTDAGRLFVYQRTEDVVLEVLRLAPWLNAARLHETRFFELPGPDQAPLSGYLTWPNRPRVSPPPLLVVFPEGFPGHAQPAFDPEAQVLADFGFAVLRLNHRSVAGLRREDLAALRDEADRVSVHDACAVIDGLAARRPNRVFDRKRIAVLGRGYGGYLAARALQLRPDVFRCGIACDAPMELGAWLQWQPPVGQAARSGHGVPAALLNHTGADWKKLSVLDQTERLTQPLLLLVEPGRCAPIDASTAELHAKLQGLGRTADRVDLEPGFAAGLTASRAAVYRKIEEFLNLHLHGFAVKVGPAKEVE